MKRIAAVFAASLLLLVSSCPSGWCQKYESSIPKGELNISYGVFNIGEFAMTFGQVLAMGFSLGHYSLQNMYFTGAVGVEGYFKTADWLYVGAIVGYEHMGGDQYTQSGKVTHDDGTSHFNAYAVDSGSRYQILVRTAHGEVKETRESIIFQLRFHKRLGKAAIMAMLRDEQQEQLTFIKKRRSKKF